MAQEMHDEEEKKERHRSPNYPAVSLREAVDRVRRLYVADGRAGAPPNLAAKHIGFSSAHGSAMAVVAALKRFGLLSETNGRLVPTQRTIEILNLPEADPRRANALREAALSPTIYSEIFESHKTTGLPADDVLEAELVTYRGFNPKAVSGFVKDFKDSLDFAGINVSDRLESANTESSGGEMNAPDVSGSPVLDRGFSITFNGGTRKYPIDISIPRGLKAELAITGDLKKEDLDKLKRQIDRLMEGLTDAFTD